jgi:hypothetical protein
LSLLLLPAHRHAVHVGQVVHAGGCECLQRRWRIKDQARALRRPDAGRGECAAGRCAGSGDTTATEATMDVCCVLRRCVICGGGGGVAAAADSDLW